MVQIQSKKVRKNQVIAESLSDKAKKVQGIKLPNKLKIGTRIYKLVTGDDLRLNNMTCLGVCNGSKGIIAVKNGDRQLMLGTLVHEMVEAICFQNDVRIPHVALSIISEQLFTVLEENKFLK